MFGFTRLSVTVKILILSGLISALFLVISFGYAVSNMRAVVFEARHDALLESMALKQHKIESVSEHVIDTVLFLRSTPPLQGIFRAQVNNGYDELGASTLEQWQERLATIFVAEMSNTNLYDQLRFIDADGYELVRVNFEQGKPSVVSQTALQYKGDREYFYQTRTLDNRSLYISKAELNREGSPPEISLPHRPVIRYAVPVYNETTGEVQGVLVANVSVDALVRGSDLLLDQAREFFLLDADGYFIYHPDTEKRWGGSNDLAHNITFTDEFPQVSFTALWQKSGILMTGSNLVVYAPVQMGIDGMVRSWLLVERLPQSVLTADINAITQYALILGGVTYVVMFLIFLFIIKKIFNPLEQLTENAYAYGRGDFSKKITITTNDEIGVLANAFNIMAKQLQILYASLEEKVFKRTEELEKTKIDLEQKLQETERMNKIMIDRELKMVELKETLKKEQAKNNSKDHATTNNTFGKSS